MNTRRMIRDKIKLLKDVKNLSYNDAIDIIGFIEPEIRISIEEDILKLDTSSIHGKQLEITMDNIITTNIDKWIVKNT